LYKVVLLRHGESIWNRDNRFTGWTDIDLSEKGVNEAKKAGNLLMDAGFNFNLGYTSVLKRAIKTLWIVLETMDLMWIPCFKSWRLNERHYGALQGLNKAEMVRRYGDEQVFIWRRSYKVQPPVLEYSDERHPRFNIKYSRLSEDELPVAESLKDTYERCLPFWSKEIPSAIEAGEQVLICAHGNSLRALVKHLDDISDEDIPKLSIPTGIPLVYELDQNLRTAEKHYVRGIDTIG
jgi:2,3-bisphosphoglycerate-dependent phosphoglycerate mutase